MIISSVPNFIVSASPAGSLAFITLCGGGVREERRKVYENTFYTPDESIIVSSLFARRNT